MTQNYPRLVNAIVSDRSYATNTQNKRFGVSIQGLPQSVPQKTYNVSDTEIKFNQSGCWTPQQDCAWFIGTALSKCDIEVCQLGDRDLTGLIAIVRSYGKVRYTTHAGGVKRGGIVFDSGTITTAPLSTTPVATITGETEAEGFTISISTEQPVDIVVRLRRTYFASYTTYFNEDISVTIPAGSLSVNLPFGSFPTYMNTPISTGSIEIFIITNDTYGYTIISGGANNVARIWSPYNWQI